MRQKKFDEILNSVETVAREQQSIYIKMDNSFERLNDELSRVNSSLDEIKSKLYVHEYDMDHDDIDMTFEEKLKRQLEIKALQDSI